MIPLKPSYIHFFIREMSNELENSLFRKYRLHKLVTQQKGSKICEVPEN